MNKPTPKKPEDSAAGSGARRQRLAPEPACPALAKVRVLLEEAEAKRGFLIELPLDERGPEVIYFDRAVGLKSQRSCLDALRRN